MGRRIGAGAVAVAAIMSFAVPAKAATYDFTYKGGVNDPTVSGSGTFTTNAANNLIISGSGVFSYRLDIRSDELVPGDRLYRRI